MNFSNKLCLSIATLISFSCFGMMRQIIRDENGFRVLDGQQEQVVQPHFVDPLLKRMSPEQLKTFVEQGNRIKAIKMSDGEYRLEKNVPGLGGGVVGAWIGSALGYGAVTFACHGTIHLVALCTGPFYVATAGTLHKMLAIPIHHAATATGIACGLAAAVATGPV